MLKSLYIENIAIIEKASLDFERGFIVLSGETGAGKSIIIDAINGIMGGRTSRELIRTGQKKAAVSAVFTTGAATEYIEQQGYTVSGGELLIERDIYLDGRNNCKIGGRPVTTAQLKDICKTLITIHGQHDGTQLLDEETHLDYLDAFGDNGGILTEYMAKYEGLLRQNRRIKALSMSLKQRQERENQLNAMLELLEELSPKEGEYEQLTHRRIALLGQKQVQDAVGALLTVLDDDDGGGAVPALHATTDDLIKAEKYQPRLEELNGRFAAALEELTDIGRSYSGLLTQDYEYDLPYEAVEARLELYETVAKKTGREEGQLQVLQEELRQELDELTMADEAGIEELKAQYAQMRKDTLDAANRLTHSREQAALRLKEQVEAQLSYLDMKNARLEVEFLPRGETIKFTKRGIDTVRFLLAANLGEGFKPLSKVASGGELSRIMLALKSVLAQGDIIDTLIFDEVDTGVSGRAANKVGEKLWSIAGEKQVICVTHLPQIAVFADVHFLVSKAVQDGSTVTSVLRLSEQEAVQEIARLTGGRDITDTTVKAAQEMLGLARVYKGR